MTETTTEGTTETPRLLKGAFYKHDALVLFAMDEVRLIGTTSSHVTLPDDTTTLLEAPGTPEWIDRMIRIRHTLCYTNESLQRQYEDRVDHWQRFGEAVLEKAEEMSWCGEYDEFAAEWGLPSRITEYDVTVSVRVQARSEEQAREIVEYGVSINSYNTEGVVTEPEFDVSTAY